MNEKVRKIKGISKHSSTKYGEMIPTNFTWLSFEKQKENANRLANITKINNIEHKRK